MITLHTKYRVPDEALQDAQKRADASGQTLYLFYARAAKNEPISIGTFEPATGLVAVVEPNQQ